MSKVGVVSKPRAQPRTFAAAARSFRRLGYGLRCGGSGLRRDGSRLQLDQHLEQQLILSRSTLLMLVGAFAEKELMDRAYAEAIRERYRFYSFGDAMLIL